jgi:DNA invertase Pin-like site-specific DNA recombinase
VSPSLPIFLKVCDTVPYQLLTDSPDWPKISIKARIRRRKHRHILAFISTFGKNIIQNALAVAVVSNLSLRLSSDGGQATLENFVSSSERSDSTGFTLEKDAATEEDSTTDKGTTIKVVPYARVSDNIQAEEGISLESQIEKIINFIENSDYIEMVTDEVITDAGESGMDFNRDGFQRVLELVKDEDVDCLLVHNIDRISRRAGDGIKLTEILRQEFDVKIRTCNTEYDVNKISDRLTVGTLFLVAETAPLQRARAASRATAENFLEHKNWSSWYNKAPIGYRMQDDDSEDNEWIKKIPEFRPIIEEIYELFLEEKNYAEVGRRVIKKYRDTFVKYDVNLNGGREEEGDTLSSYQVKRIVSRPVYKGEPVINLSDPSIINREPFVQDSDLQFVSERIHSKAHKLVIDIEKTHSTDSDGTLELIDYAEDFGIFVLNAVSPLISIRCPRCKTELRRNGGIQEFLTSDTSEGTELKARNYECPNEGCDFARRWPAQDEREMLLLLEIFEQMGGILES